MPLWVALVGLPQLSYVKELARVVDPSALTRSRLRASPWPFQLTR